MLNMKIAMLLCMIVFLNHTEAQSCAATGRNLDCTYGCCSGTSCGSSYDCWKLNNATNTKCANLGYSCPGGCCSDTSYSGSGLYAACQSKSWCDLNENVKTGFYATLFTFCVLPCLTCLCVIGMIVCCVVLMNKRNNHIVMVPSNNSSMHNTGGH